ncbi:unnamed protein product [Arabidopsis halleri]
MANVGNTSVSTRLEEMCREMTQLTDEIKKLDVVDFRAIEEVRKKMTDMTPKLKELCEKIKETVNETKETPQ